MFLIKFEESESEDENSDYGDDSEDGESEYGSENYDEEPDETPSFRPRM